MHMLRRLMLGGSLAAVLLAAGADVSGATQPAQATPASGPIAIDGRLDEGDWQKAPASSALDWIQERKPADGRAPAATSFKLLCDAQAIYLGITCQEPAMKTLQDAPVERDGQVWRRDCVEFFLMPEGQGMSYYQFVVTAGNDQFDGYFIEGGQTTIGDYSALWQSAVSRNADSWTVEIRLPLAALVHTEAGAFKPTWRFNVGRQRQIPQGGREITTWSKLRYGFNEVANWNSVAGMPAKDPRMDVAIGAIDTQVLSRRGETFDAVCTLRTQATASAAGRYRLSLWANQTPLVKDREVWIRQGKQNVRVEDLAFARTGSQLLKAELRTLDGREINGVYVASRIEYDAVSIDVREPFYRRAFYPGQDSSRIAGQVSLNLPAEQLRGAAVEVVLVQGDKSLVQTRPAASGRDVAFVLPTPELAVGDYELVATVRADGKVLGEKRVDLRKLAPTEGGCVYVDPGLNLVVDGRPIFVRSFMGGPSGPFFSRALLDKYGQKPSSEFVNFFGGYTSLQAERLDPADRERARQDVEPSAKVLAEMKKVIEGVRGKKDFYFYYMADEPECRSISPVYLRHQYELARKLDPYRAVMIITRDPARYVGCADILAPHPYLAPTIDDHGRRSVRSPKHVRETVRQVIEGGQGRIAAWCAPQAFSYSMVDSRADYLNFAEFSCCAFSAVANGAKGLTPWTYRTIFNSLDLRLGYDAIYQTLAGLEPLLIHPAAPAPVRVQAPEDGVDVLVKPTADGVLVLAVNLLGTPAQATIQSPGLEKIDELFGYRDAENPRVQKGELTLKFAPYQTRIFTYPAKGQGLSTLAQVQEEIDKANAALRKPGNILFGRGREIEFDASDTFMPAKTLMSLTDGITDAFGWHDVKQAEKPARLDMAFPAFTPKFRSARIYSSTIEDLDFLIWKRGEWVKVGEVRGNQSPVIEMQFPQTLSTVKVRLLMSKTHPNTRAELYEIELYE